MKTMYSKYNAADRTIQRDINAAVASVFHKYPDYNPFLVLHDSSTYMSIYLPAAVRSTTYTMGHRKSTRR